MVSPITTQTLTASPRPTNQPAERAISIAQTGADRAELRGAL